MKGRTHTYIHTKEGNARMIERRNTTQHMQMKLETQTSRDCKTKEEKKCYDEENLLRMVSDGGVGEEKSKYQLFLHAPIIDASLVFLIKIHRVSTRHAGTSHNGTMHVE
jgi:hypothetical protein